MNGQKIVSQISSTGSGLLLVDKPTGITSFDVIRRLKRSFKAGSGFAPKLGHAGTLDPLASGLLIIGAGRTTKELGRWLKQDKEYVTEVLFGLATDSGDVTGQVTKQVEVGRSVLEPIIAREVERLVGQHELPVPKFSAVKRAGRPLYKHARAGRSVDLPIGEMEVLAAEYLGLRRSPAGWVAALRLRVASGVYIRSLAEFLGRRLALPATVYSLRRMAIGSVSVEEALDPEEIEEMGMADRSKL